MALQSGKPSVHNHKQQAAADLFALPYSHRPELYRGFFEAEAKALLRAFFQALRA